MDHSDVRAWLDEAALQPSALDDPPEAEVAAHLENCRACSAERDALRATSVALQYAVGPTRAARERMLASVRQLGRPRPSGAAAPQAATAPRVPPAGWLSRSRSRPAFVAAALAVLLFAAGALSGALLTDEPPSRLGIAAARLGQLVRDPQAREATLRDGSGAPGGMVLYSPASSELVVIASVLAEPADGGYACYLERGGEMTRIGPMRFEGETAFWAGPVAGPVDAGRSGDRFLVMRDSSAGPPVLIGEF